MLKNLDKIGFFFCFCAMTNKCTTISQLITLLHVSTLSSHPQGACNQYLAKLHKYFKWNLHKTNVKHRNCKLYYQQFHLKYLCNLARYWLQAPWGWRDSVETCSSVIICEIIVHLLVIVQKNKRCMVQGIKIRFTLLCFVGYKKKI